MLPPIVPGGVQRRRLVKALADVSAVGGYVLGHDEEYQQAMPHRRCGGWTMILLRLLGIGAVYGVGFMFVKSLFPEPFVLLILQGGQSSEGDLTTLALVYMGVGLLAGLIAGPLFGGALLLRRRPFGRFGSPLGSQPRACAADGVHLRHPDPHRLRDGHPPWRRRPRSSTPHRRCQPSARVRHSSWPGPSPATCCQQASPGSSSPPWPEARSNDSTPPKDHRNRKATPGRSSLSARSGLAAFGRQHGGSTALSASQPALLRTRKLHSCIADKPPGEAGQRAEMLYYAYQRGDLALGQGVVVASAGGADQVFQAITAAIYFAAGDLDGPQVLHDANHGVEVVARRRFHAAYVLPFLEVLPPVTKDRHAQIVHRLDLNHIAQPEASPGAIPGTIRLLTGLAL